MLSPEILKKIQAINIISRHKANDIFTGEFKSAFKGRGMEFEEVREYFPGDDIRTIDWNVTARMDRPFVKVFREEREQTIMLIVDASASLEFGSKTRSKKEIVAEMAAVLAAAAINNNDKVGLILFTQEVEKFIAPKKGRAHVWNLISQILSFKPKRGGSNIKIALEFLARVQHRKTVSFLISDFLDEGYFTSLKVARCQHDMTALHVYDPLEQTFPSGALMVFEDLETGRIKTLDMNRHGRSDFLSAQKRRLAQLKKRFRELKVDYLPLDTSLDYVEALLKFFRMREKRMGL